MTIDIFLKEVKNSVSNSINVIIILKQNKTKHFSAKEQEWGLRYNRARQGSNLQHVALSPPTTCCKTAFSKEAMAVERPT